MGEVGFCDVPLEYMCAPEKLKEEGYLKMCRGPKQRFSRARGMAQEVRALADLSERIHSVASTHHDGS